MDATARSKRGFVNGSATASTLVTVTVQSQRLQHPKNQDGCFEDALDIDKHWLSS